MLRSSAFIFLVDFAVSIVVDASLVSIHQLQRFCLLFLRRLPHGDLAALTAGRAG
jgi:hypothetical protein